MTGVIVLLLLAVALFFAEVFIPSFGVLSLAGIACLTFGIFKAFAISSFAGFMTIAGSLVLVPTSVVVALKLMRHTSLILEESVDGEATHIDISLLNANGNALTDLHPAGKALIHEQKVDVITRGELIDKGDAISVVEVAGNRIVVARDEERASSR